MTRDASFRAMTRAYLRLHRRVWRPEPGNFVQVAAAVATRDPAATAGAVWEMLAARRLIPLDWLDAPQRRFAEVCACTGAWYVRGDAHRRQTNALCRECNSRRHRSAAYPSRAAFILAVAANPPAILRAEALAGEILARVTDLRHGAARAVGCVRWWLGTPHPDQFPDAVRTALRYEGARHVGAAKSRSWALAIAPRPGDNAGLLAGEMGPAKQRTSGMLDAARRFDDAPRSPMLPPRTNPFEPWLELLDLGFDVYDIDDTTIDLTVPPPVRSSGGEWQPVPAVDPNDDDDEELP